MDLMFAASRRVHSFPRFLLQRCGNYESGSPTNMVQGSKITATTRQPNAGIPLRRKKWDS